MCMNKKVNEGESMKVTNDVSLGAVHTPGILVNKKTKSRINKIKKIVKT